MFYSGSLNKILIQLNAIIFKGVCLSFYSLPCFQALLIGSLSSWALLLPRTQFTGDLPSLPSPNQKQWRIILQAHYFLPRENLIRPLQIIRYHLRYMMWQPLQVVNIDSILHFTVLFCFVFGIIILACLCLLTLLKSGIMLLFSPLITSKEKDTHILLIKWKIKKMSARPKHRKTRGH